MNAVAAGPSGFVAVGGSVNGTTGMLTGEQPVTWTSADGETWVRGPAITGSSGIALTGVAATPSGFVAVGSAYNLPSTSAIFRSTDGRHWKRVPDTPSFHGAMIEDVAFADGRYVAGGVRWSAGRPTAAVWTSTDGRTWRLRVLPGGIPGQVFHVASVGGGFAATGPSDTLTGAWFSTDGRTWVVTNPGGASVYEAAATDELVVIAGLEGIWTRPSP